MLKVISYQKASGNDIFLAIELGSTGNKKCVLKSEKLLDSDIFKVKNNLDVLSKMSMVERVA